MNTVIKAHLEAVAKKHGWDDFDITDGWNVYELLSEAKELFRGKADVHRWYNVEFCVVDLDGMEIGFDDIVTTGDESAREMDIEFDLVGVSEVVSEEVKTTVYKRKE
jgi:hypothetical protein